MIQKKIVLLGATGVGKTSLVRRFVQSAFDEKYLTTLGVKAFRGQLLKPDKLTETASSEISHVKSQELPHS